MGGGGSKPAPAPTVIERDPPAGSGETSVVYANKPETPRLDGITRAISNECNGCSLEVVSGVSSSSVRIGREFGSVSFGQCGTYVRDLKRVANKQLSFQDFLNNLQSGKYYRNLGNGYCEQVELSSEDARAMMKIQQFDAGKLRSVRIQEATSGGFSADTKVKITPSIPFQLRFTAGGGAPMNVEVRSMALYHPCPLRLEGVQPDAVLSLNDPSFGNPTHVILVPLVGRNTPSPSVEFLQKILPESVSVSEPDPSTGQYIGRDVPTGANWTLSNLFTVQPTSQQSLEVKNGYYVWEGMPALERIRKESPGVIEFVWERNKSAPPPPKYIMLDTPVVCSPADLAILTQRMPVTPASDAVHAVLYKNDPFQRGIVHKSCAIGNLKESFTDLRGVTEESCDPWKTWAQTASGKGFTTQQLFGMLFNAMVFVAMAVGAYLALAAVLRMYDVEVADFSKGIGKVIAVYFRSLKEKVTSLRNTIATARNPVQQQL